MADTSAPAPTEASPLTDDEIRQAALAETIISSEAFMWLMQGGEWTQSHIKALQDVYRAWEAQSGGYGRYNGLSGRMAPAPRSQDGVGDSPT